MTLGIEVAPGRVRAAALLLSVGLIAVAGLHLYWALGGTWAVHASSGGAYSEPTTGLRVQAGVMVVLLAAGALVTLARVGLWKAFASGRVVRIAMWALAVALLLAALNNFSAATDGERFGNGPVALALGLLALVVAGSGGAWRRLHRPRQTLPSH